MCSKSLVASNSKAVALAAQSAAWSAGVELKTACTAKDLGLDVTSCSQRRIPFQRERLRKARKRHMKVIKLHPKRPRLHVFRLAALPQAQYGLLSSLLISLEKVMLFFFVAFRSDPTYKYFGGRQRPVHAFSGRRVSTDADWRQS